jgi:accessory colonization factor AcfC
MKEAAAEFAKEHHIQVGVVGGRVPVAARARRDGDLVYSGSEDRMGDFLVALHGVLDPATIVRLYLRESAILVRPGNPEHIPKSSLRTLRGADERSGAQPTRQTRSLPVRKPTG